MSSRHSYATRKVLPAWGALCAAFFLLALLFSLLQPGQALAQPQDEEVWFTLTIAGLDDAKELNEWAVYLIQETKIVVYRDGKALAEADEEIVDAETGYEQKYGYVFEGRYDDKNRLLSGSCEGYYRGTWYRDEQTGEITYYGDNWKGTLEGEFVDERNLEGVLKVSGTRFGYEQMNYATGEDVKPEFEASYAFTAQADFEIAPIAAGEGEANGKGTEGSKIPGPGSWWQWLTGTVIAGIIAAIIGLINSIYGAVPPAPAAPAPAPSTDTVPLELEEPDAETPDEINVEPPLNEDLPVRSRGRHRPRPQPPTIPSDLVPPQTGIAEGTVDPFDPLKYPDQPADIGDLIIDEAGILADGTARTLVGIGGALVDGVAGFVKGIASIPGVVQQGYVEIGGLMQTVYEDLYTGRDSIFRDLLSPEVVGGTLVNIWDAVGREVLPIDEIGSFFDPHASIDQKLWAVPSAAVKIANLIMMVPELALKPVPGLPRDITLIRSARPANQAAAVAKSAAPAAAEAKTADQASAAAKRRVAAQAQKDYEAYIAAAEARAARIQRMVGKGDKLTQDLVLDAMSDPATMRNLKNASQVVKNEFSTAQANQVYKPVYEDVTGFMKGKNPNGTYRVKTVRTPGQKNLINTDNDVVVEQLVRTREGTPYWKEVPAKQWEGAYYDSFAKRSGFTPDKAKARFPDKNWDSMTPQQQHRTWTEVHGQECMDVTNPEAARAFSNQPTAMDPHWRPGKGSPVSQGRMVDGEGLGLMEGHKTQKGWSGGNMKTQKEVMEQGAKLCNLSRKLAAQSAARTGKAVNYPKVFKQGEEVLNMRDLAPAVRDQALRNLGFRGGYEEFMEKLSGWTGALP